MGFGVSSRLPLESCLLFGGAHGPLKTVLLPSPLLRPSALSACFPAATGRQLACAFQLAVPKPLEEKIKLTP